jgi:hypothetical protein
VLRGAACCRRRKGFDGSAPSGSRRTSLGHNGQSLASERGAAGLCTAWWGYLCFHNFSFVAGGHGGPPWNEKRMQSAAV